MYYFQEGGDVNKPVTVPIDKDVGEVAGVSGALAEFAGDYVTDMLGRGEALSQQPYQAYTGPLTAGTSGLQDCLLYTSPSPRDGLLSRMPSSA